MKPKLQYISHGISLTGGYYHESTLAQTLAQQIHGQAAHYSEVRFNRLFRGPFAWILLFFKAFFATNSNSTVITVARLAWPVRIKQLFGKGKMLLVLHNYDPNDGKPKLYYRLLNSFLRHSAKNNKRIQVVVVARCWQNLFQRRFGVNAALFPNLFQIENYAFLKETTKKNPALIHFGQFSDKINKKKYLILFHELKERGFVCYFSSSESPFPSHFPISFFHTHNAYLKQVAGSAVSIILNAVNEGWDRVAFESLLLGTPVIASPGGGNEEMLNQFGGSVSHIVNEIVDMVENKRFKPIHAPMHDYHINLAAQWAQPIFTFIQA